FFEREVGLWQNTVARWLHGPAALEGWRLYPIAFAGGLVASISPCILGMLPLNLSYIGASKLTSRIAALRVASLFVLGVVVVNVALGLTSSLFFALFVEYRAPVNIAVGVLTVVMGLWMAGLVRLPIPQTGTRIPAGGGSFFVGLVFALIASPCASPILVFILGAVSLGASPVRAIGAMALYAIGYTLVLFLASLFAGIATASRRVLAHSELVSRIAAVTLVVIGIGTFAYGLDQL
ncbi:MAG TPA: cytochrome c biogenesis CcdA family protein, partial [Acetobacteraceae bacterium]|nr:cytochrome c biogenesis CcdA family protein [Acetobacteraceae bacterium]